MHQEALKEEGADEAAGNQEPQYIVINKIREQLAVLHPPLHLCIVPGDGNCFFYSCGFALQIDQQEVRDIVADELENCVEHYTEFARCLTS